MNWLNNLNSIFSSKTVGKCPYCGSKNTDYAIKKTDGTDDIGYGAVWCNDCKRAFHISRIKTNPDTLRDADIPKDLIF